MGSEMCIRDRVVVGRLVEATDSFEASAEIHFDAIGILREASTLGWEYPKLVVFVDKRIACFKLLSGVVDA